MRIEKTITYKTTMSSFTKGGKACYSAKPIHNGSVYMTDIVKNAAVRGGIEEATVDYVANLLLNQVKETFQAGKRLELENIAGSLSIQGGFPTKDGAWDASRNALVPKLHAKGDLAACVADISCVNVTKGATVVVKSVMDTVHKVESELATGENVVIYVSGTGLVTSADPESGEGVWLEDYDTGVIAAVGSVTRSTSTTLDATFAEMPEPGTYWFVVASRGGLGEEYGVVQAKRKVSVVTVNG